MKFIISSSFSTNSICVPLILNFGVIALLPLIIRGLERSVKANDFHIKTENIALFYHLFPDISIGSKVNHALLCLYDCSIGMKIMYLLRSIEKPSNIN